MSETFENAAPVVTVAPAKPVPDFSSVASDRDAMEHGIPVMVDEDKWVMVAHNSAKAYQEIVKRLRKPYDKLLSVGGKIPEDKAKEINVRAAAEGLLVGWAGFTDAEGNPVEYTPEFGYDLLNASEDTREKVINTAYTTENYRRAAVDASKNAFESWLAGQPNGQATQN